MIEPSLSGQADGVTRAAVGLSNIAPMEGQCTTPTGFDERHFVLAQTHGIGRERILFVQSPAEMRLMAQKLGVAEHEAECLNENVWGLRVQRDNLPRGPDVFILLRVPLTQELHLKTYGRLENRLLDPSPRILATGEPHFLYAFLLRHEIAHHVLGHGDSK